MNDDEEPKAVPLTGSFNLQSNRFAEIVIYRKLAYSKRDGNA